MNVSLPTKWILNVWHINSEYRHFCTLMRRIFFSCFSIHYFENTWLWLSFYIDAYFFMWYQTHHGNTLWLSSTSQKIFMFERGFLMEFHFDIYSKFIFMLVTLENSFMDSAPIKCQSFDNNATQINEIVFENGSNANGCFGCVGCTPQ